MKSETSFRKNRVRPFLMRLRNTHIIPIQQVALRGDSDFVLCVFGDFVSLELKAAGEKPRPLQEHKLNKVVKAGGVRLVASPDNWEEVKQILLMMSRGENSWKQLSSSTKTSTVLRSKA